MNRIQYRAGLFTNEQRSAAMATALAIRAQTAKLWQEGMDFLNSIKGEEKNKLEAIWASPDEDETAEENPFDLEKVKHNKQENRPVFPIGLTMPADKIADPEKAAKILGVRAENI